jgi:hypothetical protein
MPAQTYACTYWQYHCEKAEIERARLPLSQSLERFMLEPNLLVKDWASDIFLLLGRQPYWHYPCLRSDKLRACATEQSAPLLVSCIFGFLEIVEILLQNSTVEIVGIPPANPRTSLRTNTNLISTTVLSSAIKFGQRSIVSALISKDKKFPHTTKQS